MSLTVNPGDDLPFIPRHLRSTLSPLKCRTHRISGCDAIAKRGRKPEKGLVPRRRNLSDPGTI